MKHTKLRNRFLDRLGSGEEFLGLFDLLPGYSFFVKDRQGRFIDLNRRGCEYCGVSCVEEAIGKTDHDFFPKQRADQYACDDRSVMDSDTAIVNRIESAPEAEGSPRLVATTKTPLHDRQGRVIGVAGFSRSIERMRDQSADAGAFEKVMQQLYANCHQNITNKELARMANLSTSQFERRFRHAFGVTPRQYLQRTRVEKAARLLADTDQSVSQIAQACGFYDHAHFSRSFRSIMTVTPSDYRQSRRGRSRENG